jgi:hypothetical protein
MADGDGPSRAAGGRFVLTGRSDRLLFQCLLATGEEIVPSNEPALKPPLSTPVPL